MFASFQYTCYLSRKTSTQDNALADQRVKVYLKLEVTVLSRLVQQFTANFWNSRTKEHMEVVVCY